MAPTDKAIAKALADVVRKVYNGPNRDQLTVNYARQTTEDSLKLADGFLKEGDWKLRSKEIIFDTLKELEAGDTEPSQQAAPTSKSMAKAAPKQHKKRVKKAPAPSDAEFAVSDASEVENAPQSRAKRRRVVKTQVKKNALSDDEEDLSGVSEKSSDEEPPKPAAQRRSKQPTESESELSDVPDRFSGSNPTSDKDETPNPAPDDDESELAEVIDEPPKRKRKAKAKDEPCPPPKETNNSRPAADDSSSELSSVIDEPPPPKRKRKNAKDTAPAKSTASRGSKLTSTDSPDEAQIKLLQSQLSKCGVRKVWAFEFKKCGADTPKAKIKHLKDMLLGVGMAGRFSEAKAREIKEMRELQADLQDVMQGEKSWGVGGGERGARRRVASAAATGRRKGLKDEGSEIEEDGGEEEEEVKGEDEGGEESDEGGKPAVKGKGPARHRPELAFLGDESESE
ncbi:hypothetical protein N657DRAFT_650543 [Parathielavia appendiculata]|uniref:Transcriptional regulator n=1 Tax=Parathielavia appendiculata TaxID=2587402 RepID=A0AAN6YZA9_9PEZI|nr:hypothetical protein N657DRAFT_650543 [Parathielavia appendiculata]